MNATWQHEAIGGDFSLLDSAASAMNHLQLLERKEDSSTDDTRGKTEPVPMDHGVGNHSDSHNVVTKRQNK